VSGGISRRAVPACCLVLALLGCSPPLKVERLSGPESYAQLNRSALMGNFLSERTLTVLRRHALLDAWKFYPDAAIARLRDEVVRQPDAWPDLFALAELNYLQGERDGSKPYFLAAAVYAYAFLFPQDGLPGPSPFDPEFRQACDIYNLGLTSAFAGADGGAVQLVSGARILPFGQIDLLVDEDTLRWGGRTLVSFQTTSNLAVEGMQNVYRAPGLGAPLAALAEAGRTPPQGIKVSTRLRVPSNLLLVMDAPRRQLAEPVLHGKILVHTIFDSTEIRVGGQVVPLEYDQTAARALSLVEASAWGNEYTGFLNGALFDRPASQLVALQPHQRGHMPVILVHGTASSPFRWADMVNDLLEVQAIRDHYEFWFFSYSTGNPIPYSALQLREAIDNAVTELGGVKADPALNRMTLIGHSQGGLLAKMQVIDAGDRLWTGISNRPLDQLKVSADTRTLLRDSLFPERLPEVQSVIFIATPHRGSYVAAFSISRLIGRLVTLPLAITRAGAEVLSGNGDGIFISGTPTRLGSIYGMSPNSPFIKSLAAIPVAPGVHAHSIIAVANEGPLEDGSDGVVRYTSAHIDDAESELVVRSGHSTQANPATIGEVQRILLEQLAPPALR
jgi:pimeloyl-ACP methyl ester carboxylesterase